MVEMTTGFGFGDAAVSGVMALDGAAIGGEDGWPARTRQTTKAASPATISRDAAKNQ